MERDLTFVFTDLESSTRLWERYPEAMGAAVERHDSILRAAVEGCNGRVVKVMGDGLMAVFSSAADGVGACLDAQRALRGEAWTETGPLRVRMGMHAGEAQPRAGDFFGPTVNRAARVMAAAHGGQVLLSGRAAALAEPGLPAEAGLCDLGEHRLKDLSQPEHIYQLVHPALAGDFPPLETVRLFASPGPRLREVTGGRAAGRGRPPVRAAGLSASGRGSRPHAPAYPVEAGP
jgi:class 3 adenylate cyclase